jgi:hypothetical protein
MTPEKRYSSDRCEAIHSMKVNYAPGSRLFWLYHQSERSNAEMSWWKRLWEELWRTHSRPPVAVAEPASVLPHWSAVPEEWLLASLIRG